jgi:hypothetical protein
MFQIFMSAKIFIFFHYIHESLGNINFQSLMWFHFISIMVRILIFLSLFNKVPSFCTLFFVFQICIFILEIFILWRSRFFKRYLQSAWPSRPSCNMLTNLKKCIVIIKNSIYSLALGLSKWTWCGHFASNITLVSVLMRPSCLLALTQGKISLYSTCPHYVWRSKIASITKGLVIENKFRCYRIYD